jgi:hypothetical protein
MDKKLIVKYITWFLALAAIIFAGAGWYYTGGAKQFEGFFGGKPASADKEGMSAGSCSVGTCG